MPDVFLVVCLREPDKAASAADQVRAWTKGDVMVCLPITHEFSESELASPNYKIIKATLDQAQIDHLMAHEEEDPMVGVVKPRRVNRVDVLALEAGGKMSSEVSEKNGVVATVLAADLASSMFESKSTLPHDGIIE